MTRKACPRFGGRKSYQLRRLSKDVALFILGHDRFPASRKRSNGSAGIAVPGGPNASVENHLVQAVRTAGVAVVLIRRNWRRSSPGNAPGRKQWQARHWRLRLASGSQANGAAQYAEQFYNEGWKYKIDLKETTVIADIVKEKGTAARLKRLLARYESSRSDRP